MSCTGDHHRPRVSFRDRDVAAPGAVVVIVRCWIRFVGVVQTEEAHPPNVPHGEQSYTITVAVGKRLRVAKIAVLVKKQAFRIEKPQMDRSEKPQVVWGSDAHAAWEQAKERAATKLDASFP